MLVILSIDPQQGKKLTDQEKFPFLKYHKPVSRRLSYGSGVRNIKEKNDNYVKNLSTVAEIAFQGHIRLNDACKEKWRQNKRRK